jgi:hypothetical protein
VTSAAGLGVTTFTGSVVVVVSVAAVEVGEETAEGGDVDENEIKGAVNRGVREANDTDAGRGMEIQGTAVGGVFGTDGDAEGRTDEVALGADGGFLGPSNAEAEGTAGKVEGGADGGVLGRTAGDTEGRTDKVEGATDGGVLGTTDGDAESKVEGDAGAGVLGRTAGDADKVEKEASGRVLATTAAAKSPFKAVSAARSFASPTISFPTPASYFAPATRTSQSQRPFSSKSK